MAAKKTFTVLFWILKTRETNGHCPLFARVTINGKRSEISLQREIPTESWDSRAQLIIGRNTEAKELNNYLAIVKAKILSCHAKLEARGITPTAEDIKNEFNGVVQRPRMLVEIVEQHNKDIKSLIGKGYAKATYVKYETTKKHLQAFLQWKLKKSVQLSEMYSKGRGVEKNKVLAE
jgi:hypothetical protein